MQPGKIKMMPCMFANPHYPVVQTPMMSCHMVLKQQILCHRHAMLVTQSIILPSRNTDFVIILQPLIQGRNLTKNTCPNILIIVLHMMATTTFASTQENNVYTFRKVKEMTRHMFYYLSPHKE